MRGLNISFSPLSVVFPSSLLSWRGLLIPEWQAPRFYQVRGDAGSHGSGRQPLMRPASWREAKEAIEFDSASLKTCFHAKVRAKESKQ